MAILMSTHIINFDKFKEIRDYPQINPIVFSSETMRSFAGASAQLQFVTLLNTLEIYIYSVLFVICVYFLERIFIFQIYFIHIQVLLILFCCMCLKL